MHRLARIGVGVAAVLAGFAIVLAASGWLYLVGPGVRLPGPTVGEALPLDELARHSAVPLVLFVAVWGTAAVSLGLLARAVSLGRLSAALFAALFVGLWGYLTTAVSILVVRQIAAESAFRDAGLLRAVVLPALLAGLGGALLARGDAVERQRTRVVLAWFTAAAGGLAVIDSFLPEHSRTLLSEVAPQVRPVASALAAPLGLALVYVSRGLARGHRRAWQLAFGLLVGSTVLHVAHGDDGALVTGALAAALLARRIDFGRPGDPSTRARLLQRLVMIVGAIYAYGVMALWANRLAADRPFSVRFALHETTTALVGGSLRGSGHLSGPFGGWFGPSVFVLGLAGAGALLAAWLAPWRYRLDDDARRRELAHCLVAKWGADTLAPFVLRADKSYFFGAGERSLVAYRVVGGVAIVSGDPLGPPDEIDAVIGDFIAHARSRGWRIAILGVSEECLALYRRHGLHALYHGDEAVLDVASFSLEGRAIRKVRQSTSRLLAAGYTADVVRAADVGRALRVELEAIAVEWRGSAPERGFVMAIDSLFRLDGDEAVFVIARSPDGVPQGFLHYAVSHRGAALSLSTMPRRRTTPNGLNEWLVCESIAWARENGFERISLNFAPFAAVLAPEAVLSSGQRVQRRALLALKGHFQLDNLLLFNRKFFPRWQRRFVVFESKLDLPRIGVAALTAESYLPFAGKRVA
jgi:lysyl-tRNA synthetase, class II